MADGAVNLRRWEEDLPDPALTLERYFRDGGLSLIRAVFENTFFVAPDRVREFTPRYPSHARYSREHYPGLSKGQRAIWQGVEVRLDDNQRAQMAWAWYTRPLLRGVGYSICHIWGHPYDPFAFTAGWNLAYMTTWARNLTEDQHPHELIRPAIRQASWDLFFRNDPVCATPDFVSDPGLDLAELLAGQPLLLLARSNGGTRDPRERKREPAGDSAEEIVCAIRTERHQSWSNLRKAIASLRGLPHSPFGTVNVANSAKSDVRKIQRETGLDLEDLARIIERLAPSNNR
jgi:hypothetical protein